jgi:hypothetical protein
MAVFLSYASVDKSTAVRVRDDLAQHCAVFLDTTSVAGGAEWEWERTIDKAIRSCQVFAPLVTTASNQSAWVARETLRHST